MKGDLYACRLRYHPHDVGEVVLLLEPSQRWPRDVAFLRPDGTIDNGSSDWFHHHFEEIR